MAKCKLCHRTTINTGCSQDNNISIYQHEICVRFLLLRNVFWTLQMRRLWRLMRATKCLSNMGSTALNALDLYSKNRAFQQGLRYFNRSLQHFIPLLIQVSLHFCFGISNPAKDRYCKSKSYCHFVIIIMKKCLVFLYSFQFFFTHKISKYLLLPLHAVLSCLQQNSVLSAPCCILNDKVVQVIVCIKIYSIRVTHFIFLSTLLN